MADFDPDAWLKEAGGDEPEWVPTVSTVFGHMLDGRRDKLDNGVGAWGDVTGKPGVRGASLPRAVLKNLFGDENKARGAVVEVLNPKTGGRIQVPIVDKGPAPWTGAGLDLTGTAAAEIGATGRDLVMYRVLGKMPETKAPKAAAPTFNPDTWLAGRSAPAPAGSFDPDAWLAQTAEPAVAQPTAAGLQHWQGIHNEGAKAEAGAVQALQMLSLPGQLDWREVREGNDAERFREAESLRAQALAAEDRGSGTGPGSEAFNLRRQADALLANLSQDTAAGRAIEGQMAGDLRQIEETGATRDQENIPSWMAPLGATLRGATDNAGATAGGVIGAALFNTPAGRVLPFLYPIGGAIAGSIAGGAGQEAGTRAFETDEETLARLAESARIQESNPTAYAAGRLLTVTPAFRPSVTELGHALRGEANALRNMAIAGTVGGATAGTVDVLQGHGFDAERTFQAALEEALFNKPTALGRKLGFNVAGSQLSDADIAKILNPDAEFVAGVNELTRQAENANMHVSDAYLHRSDASLQRPDANLQPDSANLQRGAADPATAPRPDDLPAEAIDPEVAALHAENIRLAELENARMAAVPDEAALTRQTEAGTLTPNEAYSPESSAEPGRTTGADLEASGGARVDRQGPPADEGADPNVQPPRTPEPSQMAGDAPGARPDRTPAAADSGMVRGEGSYLPDDAVRGNESLRNPQTPPAGDSGAIPEPDPASGIPGKPRRSLRSKLPPAPEGGWDIIDEIEGSVGKIRGASFYHRKGQKPPPEYDGASAVPNFYRSHLFKRDGGVSPDEAAQALYEIGWLKEPSVDLMWTEIAKAAKSRSSGVATRKQRQTEEKQASRFDRDALEPIREGKVPADDGVFADDLQKGDKLRIGKEEFEVLDVDPDGYVKLKDGKTYGLQRVEPGTVMFGEIIERAEGGPDANPDVPFSRRGAGRGEPVGDLPTAAPDAETYWQRVFRRVAPGAAEQLALKLGDPEQLAKAGLLDASKLTGNETAAYVAKEGAIYLLDKATSSELRPETMLDVLHESAHAWWDSLTPAVRKSLEKLWIAETQNRTGPLFDAAGELKPGVNRDVLDSPQEWFAEREAHDNLAWATKRAKATDHDGSIVGRVGASMRSAVLRVREAMGERPDAITSRMREFLRKGAELADAGDVAFSSRAPLPGQQQAPATAISGRLPRISRIWLGGADVIGKIKGLEGLSRAIRRHVDTARMLQGRVTAPFRAWDKRWSRGWQFVDPRKQALREFEEFQRQRDAERDPDFFNHYMQLNQPRSQWPLTSREIRDRASDAGKQLIELWESAAAKVQRRNQALNVMVRGEKGWRPIGTVTDYFPRSLRPEIMRALRNPERNAKQIAELAAELQAAGLIGSPAEMEAFINQRLRTSTQFDYLGNIEAVRQIPLPTKAYDYSFNAARRYLMSWAERVAQIEAFGQKTTKESKDLFDVAKERAGSRRSIVEYVEALRQRAYNEHPTHGWARAMQFLNSAITGPMLGNPVTIGVNLMSGLGFNATGLGWMNAMKGFWELRRLGRTIDDAYEKGILLDDLMRLSEDAEGSGSRAAEAASKVTAGLLKVTGYNASEVFVRAHGLATAKAFLRQYLRSNPGSAAAKYFEAWFRRNGLDSAKLAAEDGTGMETDKFLRTAVNVAQGGYRYDQVPVFVDTPTGRFLFKYQKWGTQAARNFMENFVKPLRHPTDWRAWRDGLRYLVTTALIGAGIAEAKERLFGVANPTASLDEIAKTMTEDDRRALQLLAQKWWRATIAAGGFGILGNYAQAATDVFDRSRFKNPLEPPGLSPLKGFGELLLTALEQKTLTKDDISQFLTRQLSLYRTMKAAAAKALSKLPEKPPTWAKDEVTRQDSAWLASVLRRYTGENDFAGRTTQIGRVGATTATPFKVEIREALLRGDPAEARKQVRAYLASVKPARRGDALKALQASVRASQPLKFEGTASEALRAGFLKWAQRRLSKEELARVTRLDRNYRAAATAAGLVNFGNTKAPSIQDVQEAMQRRAAK